MLKKFLIGVFIFLTLFNLQAQLFFSEYVEGSSYNKALEIFNSGSQDIDFSANPYLVEMYFNGNTSAGLRITLSGQIEAESVFILAHSSVDASIFPVDLVDQFQGSGWFNGDDAIVLRQGSANGPIVDSFGQIGVDPGSQWGSGDTGAKDHTLRRISSISGGDTDPYDIFDPINEWEGFPKNTFDGLGQRDGTGNGGDEALSLTIPEIQGPGHISAFSGEKIKTQGIVTEIISNGFFLQDPLGDGNTDTSDAVFVFTGSNPTVLKGDEVEVVADVTEYTPGGSSSGNLSITELVSPAITILSSNNPLPAALVLGSPSYPIPTEFIDNDNFTIFDPQEDGIDFYESLEAMVVEIPDAKAVGPINRYKEIFVLANEGENASGINLRGGISITETDFNPERIQVQINSTILGDYSPSISVNDLLGNVKGVVHYAFGNYEVLADSEFDLQPGGLEKESSDLIGNRDQVTIASFNVENLDPNDDDGDADLAEGKFQRIALHILNDLNAPDIIALQEIQDNDGSVDSGTTDASLTYETLIEAIILAGGPNYSYADIAPLDKQDGGQPGGNIRVGFLYNAQRAELDLSTLQRIEDQDLSDGDAFEASRKSLAGLFRFNGEDLWIVNNHFASKGGSTPLYGTTQPPINGKEDQREAQAAIVNTFVDQIMAQDPNSYVVLLGDFNEFQFESAMEILEGENEVVFNLSYSDIELERYSYIYQGNSQALDHILISQNLLERVEYDAVHLNAEFADQVSDHDPKLIRLAFPVNQIRFLFIKVFRSRWFQKIIWVTRYERGIEGFNVFRAEKGSDELIQLNAELIPSRSGRFQWKLYSFVDFGKGLRGAYDYYLEYVDQYGLKNIIGPLPKFGWRFRRY